MNTLLPFDSAGLATVLLAASTVIFLALERVFPGRALPHAKGWYGRALLVNLCQLGITLATAGLWGRLFGDVSLFHIAQWQLPVVEGFVGWFVGTFFFYWWHRLRHAKGWWLVFHQVHHSPSRIELLTSFYKHPVEIFSDALLAAAILYPLLGSSLAGAFWFNFFAATGEYFYHANLRAPGWLRYLIQTPQLHSVHHQFDVHSYNYGDLPLWDRLFGTYRDATEFADQCGFPQGAEERLLAMLCFKDVYQEVVPSSCRHYRSVRSGDLVCDAAPTQPGWTAAGQPRGALDRLRRSAVLGDQGVRERALDPYRRGCRSVGRRGRTERLKV